MRKPLLALHWAPGLRRQWQRWQLRQLADPRFRFMWDAPPDNEWVALDCETTGLNTKTDDIIAIGAVLIRDNRILTSERLELLVRPEKQAVSADSVRVHRLRGQDVAQGLSAAEAVSRLMHFIGSRPLVGYYLAFDVAMINRVVRPLLGVGLPQTQIEVSALYYDYKYQQLEHLLRDSAAIDLRFASLMNDLGLPLWPAHVALNDAVMAALAFVKLRQLSRS